MLQKKHRLSTAAFTQYFKTGKRRHSPHLQLIVAPAPEFHGAAVVGKKIFKQAVKRNRLRRQLYDLIYRAYKHDAISGVVILVAKPGAQQVPRKALTAEARALLSSAH